MQIEVTARVDSGEIRANAQYPEGTFLKQVPGARWDETNRVWRIPATPAAAMNLRLAVKERGFKLMGNPGMAELIQRALEQSSASTEVKRSGTLEQPDLRVYDAWRHQLEAYSFAADLDAVMLNMDMGTGKTKVVIDTIQNSGSKTIAVLCPSSVVGVWQRELEKHGVPEYLWSVPELKGSVRKRAEQASMALALRNGITVIIVNYEAAWREPMAKLLKDSNLDLVVFDEIHKIKAPGGKASRFCQQLGKTAKRRFGLTGTLMPHSPMDVYAEFRALAPDVFGTSFARFRARYAVMGGYGNHQVVAYQNEQELRDKIRFMTYEVSADVLDLPEATHVYRECDLGAPAMKAYKELSAFFYTQVESGEVMAGNALVKLLRLRQLTGGILNTDDGEVERIDTAKPRLLEDTLEDIGNEPTVVFCQFTEDIKTVHEVGKKMGRKVLELSGRVKENFAFQAGEGDILAVQIQAGGVGIDLTRARYCIYYSLGFNLGEYQQSLARVHRPGQERPVTYIHLLARGTVDQQVHNALQRRENVIKAVLHGNE